MTEQDVVDGLGLIPCPGCGSAAIFHKDIRGYSFTENTVVTVGHAHCNDCDVDIGVNIEVLKKETPCQTT
ncbi:hypothetical protein LCGC14_2677830 [marine sediment metagenome]|uniref:Uncharacterized protein n=1 Tax=marine sediment metagenome TaxID=412755 RepID=A0A0F8ZM77_9ZZZZ